MSDVLWPIARHTAAKHFILRSYLGAWFPILARYHGTIVFIDGFAGPGEYSHGEPGSPLVALQVAAAHRSNLSRNDLRFYFIEKDEARANHLMSLVQAQEIPSHISIRPLKGSFSERAPALLDNIANTLRDWPPTFVMIDPFGFSDIPYELIRRLGQLPRTEVLISFMSESVNRFRTKPELEANFDRLFGTNEWQEAGELRTPEARWGFLEQLYRRQLQQAGFTWARAFTMRDPQSRIEYHLIFGTKSREGLKQMKAAMWRADPSGAFTFSDETDPNQMTLFARAPDLDQLERLIRGRFERQAAEVEVIEDYVLFETAFRETHYKAILKALEAAGTISVVDPPPGRRRGTFPPGTKLRFH